MNLNKELTKCRKNLDNYELDNEFKTNQINKLQIKLNELNKNLNKQIELNNLINKKLNNLQNMLISNRLFRIR